MSFYIRHRYGKTTREPPFSAFRSLLRELDDKDDEEHCSVEVTHETEWSLGAYGGGYIIWENLEANSPRHMRGVSDEKILLLMEAVAKGDFDFVENEPWLPGY